MAGGRVARNRSAEHVRQTADERRPEAEAPGAEEEVGEQSAQKEVDDEFPRHRDIGREHPPQQEGRIENVAVHRSDVRQATFDERIPLRKPVAGLQRLRGEVTKRVASEVLIAPRVDEEHPT